jgi:hypothetical protein
MSEGWYYGEYKGEENMRVYGRYVLIMESWLILVFELGLCRCLSFAAGVSLQNLMQLDMLM